MTRLIDTRTITEDGTDIHFTATPAERKTLAERFDVPEVIALEVEGRLYRDDLITFSGEMHTITKRECVVTLQPFTEDRAIPVHLLFGDKDDESPEVDILPIERGKINLFEVFSEEFGLTLNPFPKSTEQFYEYRDTTDEPEENPFAVLKKLKS